VFAPCGNRRESVCPACSDRYAADAFHLLSAGLAGGDKDVPISVADRRRVLLTLTAPSFGAVHTPVAWSIEPLGQTARGPPLRSVLERPGPVTVTVTGSFELTFQLSVGAWSTPLVTTDALSTIVVPDMFGNGACVVVVTT